MKALGRSLLCCLVGVGPTSISAFVLKPARTTTSPATTRKTSTSTQLDSIPTPLDTLTSGLASICRLPKGVTALETPPTPDGQLDILPKFTKLWDIENSNDCRQVRETLTELDVVVEKIIPAGSNSRVFVDPTYEYSLQQMDDDVLIPRMEIEESNGQEYLLSGKDEIIAYLEDLKDQQRQLATKGPGSVSSEERDDDDETTTTELDLYKEKALDTWNVVGNALATFLRLGRGKKVCAAAEAAAGTAVVPRPAQPLILYSYEGNQFCRLVREVLTELDVVYELRSAGKESPRRKELAYITGGSSQCPYLIDPNTNVDMAESRDIIAYLYKNYATWTPPNEILEWASDYVIPLLQPLFRTLAPLQAAQSSSEDADADADASSQTKEIMEQAQETLEETIRQNPVVLYTYELSPFCLEAKTILDSLDVQYKEISLGKEWVPGLITPDGAKTRAALLETTGQSSLPHLFVGGKSIGGLFSGSPGLIPLLREGKSLVTMAQSAKDMLEKRKV